MLDALRRLFRYPQGAEFRDYELRILIRTAESLSLQDKPVFETQLGNVAKIRRYLGGQIVHCLLHKDAEIPKLNADRPATCLATVRFEIEGVSGFANVMVHRGHFAALEFGDKLRSYSRKELVVVAVDIRPKEFIDITRRIHLEEHPEEESV